MKMFLQGAWVDRDARIAVANPFNGDLVETVPEASTADVLAAIDGAVAGAADMRQMPAYDRAAVLRGAAQRVRERASELGRLISMEEGKVLSEGVLEASRAAETLDLSADEAKRLHGEVLPLDAAPGGANKLGFTLRVPCGVVAAITPFNFPLNLVAHKVGPALAAGNAVVLKPATDTPLSALKLVEILLESGLPPRAIACITGRGAAVGNALCADDRVRKISFTGSATVGRAICQVAGLKRVTMELGSNSPVIVLDDADVEGAAQAIAATGYANAGQVCISAQRILATPGAHDGLLQALTTRVSALVAGDPLAQGTHVGPLVREADAARVAGWIDEAVRGGARLLCGGARERALVQPAVLAEVDPQMRVSCEELFGPAVAVTRVNSAKEAVERANDSRYGLSASLFTRDLDTALRFARDVDAGNLHINWGPAWRAEMMPYGGLKESGMGKEGPRYAVQEMTESKTVVFHTRG